MATKRCAVCHQPSKIEDLDLTCSTCEEKELDLLMGVYGYIHEQGSGFCPERELEKNVDPCSGLQVNSAFLTNWIQKGWLTQNELQSVRVPDEVEEAAEENGFDRNAAAIREILNERKAEGRRDVRKMSIGGARAEDPAVKRKRMVFAESKLPDR